MNTKIKQPYIIHLIVWVIFSFFISFSAQAQSIEEWYSTAQQRIDTIRKGNFGIKILDKNGLPFSGDVSVKMIKHEFPFGIAFDLYGGEINNGNTYSTTATITAEADAEIYQSERWFSYIAYAIPVEKGRNFKLTLKFAEIYFNNKEARLFDVFVEGSKFLSDFDMFDVAGGKNIAIDSTITIAASDSVIHIELEASVDNAAIKGIEIQTVEGDWIRRINCGGGELTTTDGNYYESDEDYFDQTAPRVPTEEQWMKAAMQKYFNYGVSGNSFKWSGIQPQHTAPDYTAFDNAVEWTQSIGWELRAHTLLWGGYEYESDHELPRWVKDLPTPQAITDTCKMRVIREVTRYKGIIKEYDVMNEPLNATYLSSIVGDSINWNCFKWARSADPDAELFINEYNVEYSWGKAAEYRDLILKIKSEGGAVTGVGMQAHFWKGNRPNVTELVTQINTVAEAGLPIKLTEFDNDGGLSQEEQAADFIKVMTIAFSHPGINGMICWGLSDKNVWREKSGLFDENHRPKLAADTLLYYTHKLWSTNFDTTVVSDTAIMFDGYYGDYNIEVNFGDTVKVFSIPCIKANEDSIFVLNENDALVKRPEFVSAQLLNDTSLTIIFDKPVQPESIVSGDFKFFSDNLMRIQDIDIDPENSNAIKIILLGAVTPNDYLNVSYFPGSLSSTDGGKAVAFGPEPVRNLTTGLISAEVTNDGYNIEAQFNANILNFGENLASFTVTDSDLPVVVTNLENKDNDSSTVVLILETPLTSSSKPTIEYTRGTLTPSNGFPCQSSPVIAVSNIWPELVSAEVNSTGTQVIALFGALLQNITENQDAFTISVDDQNFVISNISETGADSTKIIFTVEGTIRKSQKVTLSYQPGTIKGMNGNSLQEIKDADVSNKSTLTDLESITMSNLSIYPNPAMDKIQIVGDAELRTVSIFNNQGLLIYKNIYSSKSVTIDVKDFPEGIYIVQIVDTDGNVSSDKIILNK